MPTRALPGQVSSGSSLEHENGFKGEGRREGLVETGKAWWTQEGFSGDREGLVETGRV